MTVPRPVKLLVMLIPWCIAAGIVLYVFSIRFPIDGKAVFSHPFDGSGIWFTPFEPGERVTSPGAQDGGWRGQRILDEPVYASARWPGAYDELNIAFDMRTIRQPLVELGLERGEGTRAFEMQPLWSEELSSERWREAEINGLHGFVREDLPDEALLEQDPKHLMVWHASTSALTLSDAGASEEKSYDISLRGTHHFHVVPLNGEIRLRFELQDVNRNREGKNTYAMRVTCDDEIIWTKAGGASGLHDSAPTDVFTEMVHLTDLKPCVYRLSLLADNDFFIRRITTPAKHWVIGPQIFFGDRVGYRATSTGALAWTNSLHVVVDTFHEEGKQDVSLGSETASIRETHARYVLERAGDERDRDVRFAAPNGNVRVIGDGYFALSEDASFYPQPRRLTVESMPAEEGIRAIITPYESPEELGGGFWRVDTSYELPYGQDRLQFSLAAPGIYRTKGAVDIRHVTLEYTRPALSLNEWFNRMKQELALALRRL